MDASLVPAGDRCRSPAGKSTPSAAALDSGARIEPWKFVHVGQRMRVQADPCVISPSSAGESVG
jgi:hypothetical protein